MDKEHYIANIILLIIIKVLQCAPIFKQFYKALKYLLELFLYLLDKILCCRTNLQQRMMCFNFNFNANVLLRATVLYANAIQRLLKH